MFTRVTAAESIIEEKVIRKEKLCLKTMTSNSSGLVGFVNPGRKELLDLMCQSVFFLFRNLHEENRSRDFRPGLNLVSIFCLVADVRVQQLVHFP